MPRAMVQTRTSAKRIEAGNPCGDQVMRWIYVVPVQESKLSCSDKTAGPAKRRRRGKPGKLCRLDLDVLFLIAAHVHPIDLLNLSRTCKSLRELLMSRASKFVWRTARHQVKGLPDCPADMTEPEYANLVFYARCHGCGKHTKKIFWSIRRRYCSDCKLERLCFIDECDEIIGSNCPLPMERLFLSHKTGICVDKAQMKSLVDEYNRSSDKDRFSKEQHDRYAAICQHAQECQQWEKMIQSKHRSALHAGKKERARSIFERLRQLGFGPEINYFLPYCIRSSNFSFFDKAKPLTNKEWNDAWPEWLNIMNSFRHRRLDATVYQPRRKLLESEYMTYVTYSPEGAPYFDCLPDPHELADFAHFRDIILAPEGAQLGDKPFESAFSQLPGLVDKWKEKIDSKLAELVKIPGHLSVDGAPKHKGQDVTPGISACPKPMNAAVRKLNLASAVFVTNVISTYPDVLHTMSSSKRPLLASTGDLAIEDRFNIKFLEDAPYIVHACGLDPNIATLEDMDKRDARLRCLVCDDSRVRRWRDALTHANEHHGEKISVSKLARWQAISDEYKDAIRVAERSIKTEGIQLNTRCLVCQPYMGDATSQLLSYLHIQICHGFDAEKIELGIHYESVGIREDCSVEMVEEGGHVMFKDPILCSG